MTGDELVDEVKAQRSLMTPGTGGSFRWMLR